MEVLEFETSACLSPRCFEVLMPDDTVAGAASVQISAAWIKGATVSIPTR
jgi:hypothetical protein